MSEVDCFPCGPADRPRCQHGCVNLRVIPRSDPHDCGHFSRESGCGGCDPGAIEFVIADGGVMRAFNPERDMR